MSTGLAIYLGIGLLLVLLEHRMMADHEEEPSSFIKCLGLLQLVIHYFRLMVVWPTYLLEDGLIYLSCMRGDDDEDENE